MKKILWIMGLGLLCSSAVQAANDIKPGLWEMQTQTALPNGMKMPDVSQLPPELLSKLAQRGISVQGGVGGALTVRTCVSKEQASKGFTPQPPDTRCRNADMTRSGNSVSWRLECATGEGRLMSGQGQVVFASADSYSGSMNITVTEAGRGSLSTTTQLQGHWVGECH